MTLGSSHLLYQRSSLESSTECSTPRQETREESLEDLIGDFRDLASKRGYITLPTIHCTELATCLHLDAKAMGKGSPSVFPRKK